MSRKKDYLFKEFNIVLNSRPDLIITVKTKIWFSYEEKTVFVTEHLGKSLMDTDKTYIEIDDVDIEEIIVIDTYDKYSIDGYNESLLFFDEEDDDDEGTVKKEDLILDEDKVEEEIIKMIKEDYTKYFTI